MKTVRGQGSGVRGQRSENRLLFPVFCILCSMLCILFLPINLKADPSIPERLTYSLYWIGVKAGTATMQVEDTAEGINITSRANSDEWVSVFYTVEDFARSAIRPDGYPKNYRIKIREGRHRRDKEVQFYTESHKALYNDYIKNEQIEFDLQKQAFDPLSGLYELRKRDLRVGRTEYIDNIFDSKKLWSVEVQVLRKEKIKTPAGEFDTIVVKPIIKSEGLFMSKGEILIWLTDDLKKVPVMMKTKIKLGSITATLTGGEF
ncbi:MAG: DUF3108 domain-containing protein [Nitrospirae bacterium]|nr:DUF3108 domain-containing protein [Nitrospirota bacterium]